MTPQEMKDLGWSELDILLISGDAYVDHPSFGVALLGRFLVSQGFRVGVIAQPDWKDPGSVTRLGRPRLFAGVTAGAMDSMVSNYTANKKLRRDDAYSPGGRHGRRPNRATLIYTNLIKHAYPGLPVVLGGIEASLRRLVHYDYWEDKVRRSLLVDAKADLLVYGMGERAVAEIARHMAAKSSWDQIPGTAVVHNVAPLGPNFRTLPGYEEILKQPELLLDAALAEEAERDWRSGKTLSQPHGDRWVIVYPPAQPLSTVEMDRLYALPFTREAHPSYTEPIPALEPVATSIVLHRGCFGGCTFCALGAHQGKSIQSRSADSVVAEVKALTQHPRFHGTLTDLGGPTANMYALRCNRPQGECERPSCLFPQRCKHLLVDHGPQIALLRRIKQLPGVKHAFIASGIRYDLALEDPNYIPALVQGGHVSGALKVAPEHADDRVLALMRKPPRRVFERFIAAYREAGQGQGQTARCTAYFISAFPGSQTQDMVQTASFARGLGLRVEQMQDFIPLPMTLAGVMYFTGLDPWTRRPLVVARTPASRQAQRRTLVGPPRPAHQKRRFDKRKMR